MHENIYLPFRTSIRKVKELAKDVKLFSIAVPQDFTYQAGQFVMVSVMGSGEIPISITSTPAVSEDLEICVRTVGHVSRALNSLAAGDAIWVRGPYGRPFPVNGRQDTLFVCGGIGIVPLRPLINQMVSERAQAGGRNGAVTILYGSRNPAEVLFMDEVSRWEEQGASVVLTVDACSIESWKGCTGLVTEHFGKAKVNFKSSTAYLCGPHVMIQAAMRDLSLMGMPDDHIITTLEAHMKCGVGKCGHCYCGGKLICEDGPVFSLEEIKKYNIQPGRDDIPAPYSSSV
ncbi:MAG TPA: FAD/NAD(P)-binding protein [Nitrospirota bacterium]